MLSPVFSSFIRRYPDAWLLVAVLPQQLGQPEIAARILREFIAMLPPTGDYAVGVFRQIANSRHPGVMEIHCVFENASDAERVAQIFGAEVVAASRINRTWEEVEADSKIMTRAYLEAFREETQLKAPTKHLREYQSRCLAQNTQDKAVLRSLSTTQPLAADRPEAQAIEGAPEIVAYAERIYRTPYWSGRLPVTRASSAHNARVRLSDGARLLAACFSVAMALLSGAASAHGEEISLEEKQLRSRLPPP